MRWSSAVVIFGAMALATAARAQAPAPQPVYVMLVSTVDDHLNEAPSFERVERTLPVIERYRRDYPQYAASWLVRFSGTVSERLAETNYTTHLVDRLMQRVADGSVEVGYDGTEEPTFVARPRPNFRNAHTPEARWLARIEALEWFLTEAKDPLSGAPVAGRTGGLRKTLDVFGGVVAVRGATLEIGGDPELAHVVRRMGVEPLMPGFGENTVFPGRTLSGYRGGTGGASAILSPAPDCAPEVFWQDGLLALSDFVGPDSRIIVARDGMATLRKALDALDRTHPHVVQVRLGHPGVYVKPGFGERRYQSPLEFSYENPRSPTVPADALRTADERAVEYAKEDDVLGWLVREYFPANPGSRFLSVAELTRMARATAPASVSRREIAQAARAVVEALDQAPLTLPTFVRAGDQYLSLAETFGLLATSLAQIHQTGGLPESVPRASLHGPRGLVPADPDRAGTRIAVGDVRRAASAVAASIASAPWTPIPAASVPSVVRVAGHEVTAAQFLLLMADAVLADRDAGDVVVRHVSPLSVLGETFPGTRPPQDRGTTWTLAPARLGAPAAPHASAARQR